MRLDVDVLRYLSKDDFRVLTAIEMGLRNHEVVPSELIDRIASLKHGGTYKVLKNLLKHKLVHHESSKYDGFRLTYLGYDFLAIKTMVNRGVLTAVGRQIGVGKESDIFEVATEDGEVLVMKLHRLGRTSFRAVKSKRDYLRHRSSYNWFYLSRLAALKEFAFMKALEEHGFPVPHAIDCNRHCVVMSRIQGYPLAQIKQLQNPDVILETIIGLVVRLAEHGLIHCDFNEFNIMIDDDENVMMIDFPQMVSVSHRNAQMYFDRDVECIFKFFRKRFNLSSQESVDDETDDLDVDLSEYCRPQFSDIKKVSGFLDRELAASGFTGKDRDSIEQIIDGDSPSSDDEETQTKGYSEKAGANIEDFDSLCIADKEEENRIDQEESAQEEAQTKNEGHSNDEGQDGCEPAQEEDRQIEQEDEPGLAKRLNRQRRRAIQAARGGKKCFTSRNTYKDKGGRLSHNSKIQKQLSSW